MILNAWRRMAPCTMRRNHGCPGVVRGGGEEVPFAGVDGTEPDGTEPDPESVDDDVVMRPM